MQSSVDVKPTNCQRFLLFYSHVGWLMFFFPHRIYKINTLEATLISWCVISVSMSGISQEDKFTVKNKQTMKHNQKIQILLSDACLDCICLYIQYMYDILTLLLLLLSAQLLLTPHLNASGCHNNQISPACKSAGTVFPPPHTGKKYI